MKKYSITISQLREFLDTTERRNIKFEKEKDKINIGETIFLPMFNKDAFFNSEKEKEIELNNFIKTVLENPGIEKITYKQIISALLEKIDLAEDKISELKIALERCEY